MANPWFKLYGIEYLADPKIQRLTASERSCWITLLSLASMDGGVVHHCEESYLMAHSGVDPLSPEWNKTCGVIYKFEMLGMVKKEGFVIHIINWQKRQEVYSESKERVQRWREKQRVSDNVTPVTLRVTARREENRIDKNRIEENRVTSVANATDTDYTKDFLYFWNEYPKKVGKGDAYRAWKKAKRPDIEVIITELAKQKLSPQWLRNSGQFIPNPGTWLNQRRWEDELSLVTSNVDKY